MILNLSMAISSPVKKPIFNPNPKYPTIKYKDPKYPTIKYKDPKYPTTSSHFFTIFFTARETGEAGGFPQATKNRQLRAFSSSKPPEPATEVVELLQDVPFFYQ
jgi:hypothetical protein